MTHKQRRLVDWAGGQNGGFWEVAGDGLLQIRVWEANGRCGLYRWKHGIDGATVVQARRWGEQWDGSRAVGGMAQRRRLRTVSRDAEKITRDGRRACEGKLIESTVVVVGALAFGWR
ncbi:hypothetical protein U1Q18_002255 [Sarracenia purpurea var. burkii]